MGKNIDLQRARVEHIMYGSKWNRNEHRSIWLKMFAKQITQKKYTHAHKIDNM